MRYLGNPILPIVMAISFTSLAAAQSDRYFTVEDGRIQLHGSFADVSRIQILSRESLLSQDTEHIPLRQTEPFPPNDGLVVVDNEHEVVIGVLGPQKRISIDGETTTAILYSESLETAAGGDLSVLAGIADAAPFQLSIGSGDGEQGATITNGAITLVGSFSELAGIQAKSVGGYLSLDQDLDAPADLVRLTSPFTLKQSVLLSATDSDIEIRVLHEQFRFDLAGDTPTSFLYSGAPETTRSDLTVRVGTGTTGFLRRVPFVPEPSSGVLGMLSLFGLFAARRSRQR